MDVETLAVNEITSMIARCPGLSPLIATNDKTPFTDGHIDIYHGLNRSNDEWVGRVSVQVKGRTTPANGKLPKSYPISRTDLQAFQSDSGVLYFVVFVDGDTGEGHPFYVLLSPFYIERILQRAAPTTKRISVPLRGFPTNPGEIDGIVRVARRTREQLPSAGDVSSLFPQAQSLSVYSAQNLNFDAPVVLVPGETDFALVLTTTDGLSLPLNGELRIFPPTYVSHDVDVKVECGDVVFDGVAVQMINEEFLEMVVRGAVPTLQHAKGGTAGASLIRTDGHSPGTDEGSQLLCGIARSSPPHHRRNILALRDHSR